MESKHSFTRSGRRVFILENDQLVIGRCTEVRIATPKDMVELPQLKGDEVVFNVIVTRPGQSRSIEVVPVEKIFFNRGEAEYALYEAQTRNDPNASPFQKSGKRIYYLTNEGGGLSMTSGEFLHGYSVTPNNSHKFPGYEIGEKILIVNVNIGEGKVVTCFAHPTEVYFSFDAAKKTFDRMCPRRLIYKKQGACVKRIERLGLR